MIQLLVWKDRLREIYRKYSRLIIPVVRFLMAMLVFTLINKQMGYEERIMGMPIVLALSAFSAIVPSAVLVLLAAAVVLVHLFAASKLMMLVFLVIMVILYCLFVRFVPKYGWVVLAIPVLYCYHIPYVIPFVLGLIASPMAALAAGCGVVVHYVLQLIKEAAVMVTASMGMEDTLALYTYVLKSLVTNRHMILTIGIFAVIIFLIWFVRRLKIVRAYEIAIVTGTVMNILLFLLGDLVLGVSGELLSVILGSLISGLLAYVIQFLRFTLDYSTVENVQFEDDDYYYYVKAVPKLRVTTPEVSIKTFTSTREYKEMEEEYQEEPYYGAEESATEEEEFYASLEDYEEDRPIK